MQHQELPPYTAFAGDQHIASGDLHTVVRHSKAAIDCNTGAPVLIFDNATSRQVEIDFRGDMEQVLNSLSQTPHHELADTPPATRGPGRPKLGVIAREVTLLPRHWDWLNTQRGGASVALRRLVEEAKRANADADRTRQAMESLDRFMHVMAGDLPGYEEATRRLYRKDRETFEHIIASWPASIRAHVQLLADAFPWNSPEAAALPREIKSHSLIC